MSTPTPPTARADRDRRVHGASATSTSRTASGCRRCARTCARSWRRREFAIELRARSCARSTTTRSFGQLWLVLNPLLLARVYFMLVDILRGGGTPPGLLRAPGGGHLRLLLRPGRGARRRRSRSTTGGKLILNTRVPARAAAAVVGDHGVHALPADAASSTSRSTSPRGLPVEPDTAVGDPDRRAARSCRRRARDDRRGRAGLLPRPHELPALRAADLALHLAGPLLRRRGAATATSGCSTSTRSAQLLTAWSDVLHLGHRAGPRRCCSGAAWASASFVVGGLFFISREREFAVRL